MLQGFLQFKREIKFQKRWFVLKGNMLFYFDKKGDKEPLGLLLLEGCKVEIIKAFFDFRVWKFHFRHRRAVWRWRFTAILLPACFSRREQSNILLRRSLTDRNGVVDEKFNLCKINLNDSMTHAMTKFTFRRATIIWSWWFQSCNGS